MGGGVVVVLVAAPSAGAAPNFEATLAINPNDMFAQMSLISLKEYL